MKIYSKYIDNILYMMPLCSIGKSHILSPYEHVKVKSYQTVVYLHIQQKQNNIIILLDSRFWPDECKYNVPSSS